MDIVNIAFCRLINGQDSDARMQAAEEGFLIRSEGKPSALLPEDLPLKNADETAVLLQANAEVNGFAGNAGVPVDRERKLGGWCSFACRLAVPRRFTVRAGRELAAGADGQELVAQRMRDALQEVFEKVTAAEADDIVRLRKRLSEQLKPAGEKRLMELGWQMTHCKLEKILITRSEQP